MASVRLNGREWTAFDAAKEVVSLGGLREVARLEVTYGQRAP